MKYRGKKDYSRELIETTAAAAKSKHDMLKVLGLPTAGSYGYRTLNYFVDLYSIDVSHFGGRELGWKSNSIVLDDILKGKHPRYASGMLRLRLIKENVLPEQCAQCGLSEWQGLPIPLELDHINGKSWDHRLENLRILCRNCHGQTATFCGRNIAKNPKPDAEPSPYRTALANLYADRARILESSSIDFTVRGWVKEAAELLGMRHQKVSGWMKVNMPAFYDKCLHR